MIEVPLHEVAHGRAGDKGNCLNISVIPYHRAAWGVLGDQLTEERVLEVFAHRGADRVRRFDLPRLGAFNFVIDNVLEGGVNSALNLDGHGKTMSFRLLATTVRVERSMLADASPWKMKGVRGAPEAQQEEKTP